MDERILQFRVGVMVAATLLITAILIATFGDLSDIVYGGKAFRIWVDSAPGVQEETPIRKSGILIGRVTSVELADGVSPDQVEQGAKALGISPDEFRGGVVITATIHRERQIYADETFLVNATLLGDVVIEVTKRSKLNGRQAPAAPVDGDNPNGVPARQTNFTGLLAANAPAGSDEPVLEGAWFRGDKATDPTEGLRRLEQRLPEVFDSVKQTSDELNQLISSVNGLLDQNRTNIDKAIQETTVTMESIRRLADSANGVIGDPEMQADLREALERLPNTVRDIHETVISMRGSVDKMNRNLNHIENFTRPLGENGDRLVGGIDSSIRRLDALLAELVQFSQAINDRQGSLGQLVHDRQLYDNLNQTVLQVKCLTRKLEPIIDDARVISDKVARHPGVIVRDAVRPGVGIK
jgi:phospholipid/cholesterol/gamma-HCH transport system substrate-binding protein